MTTTTLERDMEERIARLRREKADLEAKLDILTPPASATPEERAKERRLREIAIRNYDHSLARGWDVSEAPEEREKALLLDLAKLEQDLMRVQYRARMSREYAPAETTLAAGDGPSVLDASHLLNPLSASRSHSLIVYLEKRGAREMMEIDRRDFPDLTTGAVVRKACGYWSLPPSEYVLLDAEGITWPTRSRISEEARFVVLRRAGRPGEFSPPGANEPLLPTGPSEGMEEEDEEEESAGARSGRGGREGEGGEEEEADDEAVRKTAALASEVPLVLNRKPRGSGAGCRRLLRRIAMLYILAVSAVFAVGVLDYRDVSASYQAYLGLRRAMGNAPWIDSRGVEVASFSDIETVSMMYDWISGPAIDYLTRREGPSAALPYLVGGVQVAQIRVRPNAACSVAPALTPGASSSSSSRSCYAAVSSYSLSTETFDASLAPPAPFTFRSPSRETWPSLVGSGNPMVPGIYTSYPLGGFGFYAQSSDPSTLRTAVAQLRNASWVNNGTRAVMLSATLYSPPAASDPGVFIVVMALFELFPGGVSGGVASKWVSVAFSDGVRGVGAFDVAMCVLIALYAVVDGFSLLLASRGDLFRGWRVMRLSAYASLLIFVVLYTVGNEQLRNSMRVAGDYTLNPTSSSSPSFVDYRVIAMQFDLLGDLAGVTAALLALSTVIPGLEASNKFRAISHTASLAIGRFTGMLLFTLIFSAAWALAIGHFVFGAETAGGWDWTLVDLAFANLWNFGRGGEGSSSLIGAFAPSWGYVVFAVLVYLTFYVACAWLFFAIVSHAYVTVQDRVRKEGSRVALAPEAFHGYGEPRPPLASAADGGEAFGREKDEDEGIDIALESAGRRAEEVEEEEEEEAFFMARLAKVEEESGKVEGPGAAYLHRVFRGAQREFE